MGTPHVLQGVISTKMMFRARHLALLAEHLFECPVTTAATAPSFDSPSTKAFTCMGMYDDVKASEMVNQSCSSV
jgi:hypothetical protein